MLGDVAGQAGRYRLRSAARRGGTGTPMCCLRDRAAAQTSSAADAGRDVSRGSFQGLAARHWHWPHASCQKVCWNAVSLKQGTRESLHDSIFPGCLCSHASCTLKSHAALLRTISSICRAGPRHTHKYFCKASLSASPRENSLEADRVLL